MTRGAAQPFVAGWYRLTIVGKLTVFLAGIAFAGLFGGKMALDHTIRPTFEQLEWKSVDRRINVADRHLRSVLANIEGTARDYGIWDDSFSFIAGGNPSFADESLTGLTSVGINGVAYVKFDGELLYAHYLDLQEEKRVEPLHRLLVEIATDPEVINTSRSRPHHGFFANSGGRLVVIGASRIVRSDGSGSPAGFLLMAREITEEEVSEALQTRVRILPPDESAHDVVETEKTYDVQVPAWDSAGEPVARLGFQISRDISALGHSALLAAFAASSLIIVSMLLLVGYMINAVVGRRLAHIERHIQSVAVTGELSPLPDDPNSDELGSLSLSFNKMIVQLRELREQLRLQSYKLGRGEWAAGVVHNVRNALNPVTVIMSKLALERRAARSEDLVRALKELAAADCPPERRQALSAFLLAAQENDGARLQSQREDLLSARSLLSEAIRILGDQHKIAHEEIPLEPTNLLELVEQNIAMVRFVPWGEISVTQDGAPPLVAANRLLLSQVVGNLLTNAVEAIAAADRRPGAIRIGFERVESDSDTTVRLSITDDGTGFEPSKAETLFKRGHSSKTNGSGGLGLHWCANIVTAMGGALTIRSEGVGRGATATISLAMAGAGEDRIPRPAPGLAA